MQKKKKRVVNEILWEGGMRCKMNKLTLLKIPYCNIPNRELITRIELSQIQQDLYDFRQSYRYAGDSGFQKRA